MVDLIWVDIVRKVISMAYSPQTLEQLARIGANLEIGAGNNYMPQTLENLVRLVVGSGAHITIHSTNLLPQTLEQLARIGGSHLTIRV
ncbi:hypothetical protein [Comamonas terrigena]|uniref:hypothetical protein n=1 Tax=Comamonas terrigena TaxID=32013 RepID=UPI000FD66E86|nr:hypothetical protein [Comamonas terrigena]